MRSRTSVASIIFGLLFFIPMINFLFGAMAIYFGIDALNEIKERQKKGKYLAIGGILLGTLPFYFGALYFTREVMKNTTLFVIETAVLLPLILVVLFGYLKSRKLI